MCHDYYFGGSDTAGFSEVCIRRFKCSNQKITWVTAHLSNHPETTKTSDIVLLVPGKQVKPANYQVKLRKIHRLFLPGTSRTQNLLLMEEIPEHLENTGDNLYHINMVSLPDFSHQTVGLVMYLRQLKVSCWGLDRNQNKTQYNTRLGVTMIYVNYP